MRLKQDAKYLQLRKSVRQFAEVERLTLGAIEDCEEYYGHPVGDVEEIDNVIDALQKKFGNGVVCEVFGLVLMGDGDCPECGGNMEMVDGQYHNVNLGSRELEPEMRPVWEKFYCPVCGKKKIIYY